MPWVKPHLPTRGNCVICGRLHTLNEHRFHERGAYYKTHKEEAVKQRRKLGRKKLS